MFFATRKASPSRNFYLIGYDYESCPTKNTLPLFRSETDSAISVMVHVAPTKNNIAFIPQPQRGGICVEKWVQQLSRRR